MAPHAHRQKERTYETDDVLPHNEILLGYIQNPR